MFFDRVAVLGVGLIGASLALAMKKSALCGHVVGYGRSEENLKKAKERAIIDSFEPNPSKACEGADLIAFATPVGRFASLAEEVKGSVKKGAAVIDVGSVKGRVVGGMERIFGERFVGCHPIAGSERSGIDAASADLFKGALCVITGTGRTDAGAAREISLLWEKIGSRVELMSPEEHDRIFALVSHLPHVVSYALVNTVADFNGGYLKYAGKGFKDTTRIASSSPVLWRDICLMNRENIIGFIDSLKENLERLSLALRAEDSEAVEAAFRRAGEFRESLRDIN